MFGNSTRLHALIMPPNFSSSSSAHTPLITYNLMKSRRTLLVEYVGHMQMLVKATDGNRQSVPMSHFRPLEVTVTGSQRGITPHCNPSASLSTCTLVVPDCSKRTTLPSPSNTICWSGCVYKLFRLARVWSSLPPSAPAHHFNNVTPGDGFTRLQQSKSGIHNRALQRDREH
jgi:hypothetical protein